MCSGLRVTLVGCAGCEVRLSFSKSNIGLHEGRVFIDRSYPRVLFTANIASYYCLGISCESTVCANRGSLLSEHIA